MTANPRFEWINWNVRVVRNRTASYDTDSTESGSENDSNDDTGVSYDTPPPAGRSASRTHTRRLRAESGHGARAAPHNAGDRADAGVGDNRQLMTDGGRTAKADIDDPELLSALEEAEQEHGSMAEALRHAVRTTYAASEDGTDPTVATDLPTDLRDGYAALRDRYGTGSRIGLESAKSVIAQATKTPSEDTIRTVIEPLRQRGYLGVHTGRAHVAVIIPDRTASDGGHNPEDRDGEVLDDNDTDDVDVDGEFARLESAAIDRGDGIETDGGSDADRIQCPYNGCDWESREYDPNDYLETVTREEDAVVHWEDEHDGEIPDSAEFGDEQCPECYAAHGLNGTVSCSECGHIPEEVRADGAGERIAVSPLTGIIYAVSEYEEDGDGRITAFDERPLSRAEIGDRLGDVHGPVRRAYREALGGDA